MSIPNDAIIHSGNMNELKVELINLLIASNAIIENSNVKELESNKDIVTKADVEISKMISSYLLENFSDVTVETEELGIRSNSEKELLYFAVDDIDGTDNYYRGNGMLPYCTCICVFEGTNVTSHFSKKHEFQDMIAGCCIEHLSKTIFYAEKGQGIEILNEKLEAKEIQLPTPNTNADKSTRILTDLYAGKPRRLTKLYETTWVKDFSSSALHYCLAANGFFDGLVFETYKAHELGLAYIFTKESGRWLSDFSMNLYDLKPYVFSGAYEVLIANTEKLADKLTKLIE